jgi:hypothetical protein
MTKQAVCSAVLAAVFAANQTVLAQRAPTDAERWRTFAQSLGAGALVEVQLRDGTTVRGTLVSAQETALQVQPHTRLQMPVRSLSYRDVDVIDRWRKGWSPGTKTLVTIGAGFGVMLAVTAAVLAASYE